MEKELQSALIEILNAAVSAKDFLVAEIPEVAHQLLVWKTVESVLWCGLAMVVFALSFPVYKVAKKVERELCDGPSVIATWMCVFLVVFIGCVLFDFDWLKIQLAPKLYLAEYAMELTRRW